ncbi:MAG: GNAT family N-acetyltransferase [Lachnospiraceae bacterium]|nr:GNAT family N-acetyltransferase [Lachnospiraceae bacterium]
MEWKLKTFEELTNKELYEILKAREEIFIIEQTCIYPDIDSKDFTAYHLFSEENGILTSYLRILPKGIRFKEISFGRVITKENYRRKGLGLELMKKALHFTNTVLKEQSVRISAQAYLLDFYGSLGFKPVSELYLEDGIDHYEMLFTASKDTFLT